MKKIITQVDVSVAIKKFRKRGGIVRKLPAQINVVRESVNINGAYENIFERV